MSQLNLTINGTVADKMKGSSIPQKTYFTGRIGNYPDRAFFKCYDLVVSLQSGDTWDECTVIDYVECDATLNLKSLARK